MSKLRKLFKNKKKIIYDPFTKSANKIKIELLNLDEDLENESYDEYYKGYRDETDDLYII